MRLRTPKDIGAMIRDQRRVLALTQSELAHRIGVSRLWVGEIEQGKPGASLGPVLRALAAVGVDLFARTHADRRDAPDSKLVPDISAIVRRARGR